MKSTLVIEPHYFGSLEYFCLINQYQTVSIEIHQHYTKQTYKTRCHLLSPQGVKPISIPVHYRNHQPLKEVKIDQSHQWKKVHLGMLSSSYGKAAFFDHYFPQFESIHEKRHTFLIDLLTDALSTCLEWLSIEIPIQLTEDYRKHQEVAVFDARELILPKRPYEERNFYRDFPYFQNFGNKFEPNLSLLDSLFNMGPETKEILVQSTFSD